MKRLVSVFSLCVLFSAVAMQAQTKIDADRELAYCARQVDKALSTLQAADYHQVPRNILSGQTAWNCRPVKAEEWCSGFWPGILWMDYGLTGSAAVRRAAEGYTEAVSAIVSQPVYDHDLCFIVINALLKGYEATGLEHYRQTALQAADSLATLYNNNVGTMLSWPRHVKDYGGHNTIMDNMMNLELLFWADRQTVNRKAQERKYYDMAARHADVTMQHHFRPDGSCYHVAVYDTLTGRFLRGVTHQGYSDASMWSRGQAWAVYGYTMVYRYTREQRFLRFAQKVADAYLRRLQQTSDDWVPLWDMDAPQPAPKDASAACVVASALLELDGYVPGRGYRKAAESMLADLSTERYQSRERNVGFLMHSTGHHPAGSEVDASIIYADYYYIEALQRLKAADGYQMAGPYAVIARDGQYRHTKGGSERDMRAALDFAQRGDTAQARRIIDAYGRTLQRIDGHDAPLCLIQCYWLVSAMTLTAHADTAMIRRAILPVIERFDADSPYANGNWGAIVNRCRMACAICLRDSTLYQQATDYFLHADDNGSLPRYIGPTGQCQETGRDQQHVQLGLQALADVCEMAWQWQQQGEHVAGMPPCDLYGALDNRLLQGLEYTAKYNLGHDDMPFETWTDCTGLYCDWTEPGTMGRGRIRDIYRQPYRHYVGRRRLKMPYTRRLLQLQDRAERAGTVKHNIEADEFTVEGVREGAKLHRLFTYPAPEGAPLKHDYDVYARPRSSKEWTRIDTYMAKANAPTPEGGHRVTEYSYAMFDFTGDVFVRVVSRNKKFSQACVRPDYRGVIANVQNDSTAEFLLFQPENLSVEFDGDMTHNLLLFTSRGPLSRERAEREARAQGRQFRYYAPGLYRQDTIRVESGTTVYLEGGSYFTGTFAIEDARDVSIVGRGIARPSNGYEGCHVHRSKNVVIDGLVLCTCPVGGSDGVSLHDVRCLSHPAWGDGLNVFASSNVTYDRVFCRTSDDCTTAYATRKGFRGNARNITMRNATLWADVAHPIFIGIHGDAQRGDTIENLRYENIDILCQAEPQVDYQGCMAINCCDNNLVRNVSFDNIRIENVMQGSLLQLKVGWNQKYCAAPGRGVEDVTFSNIRYRGDTAGMSVVNGYMSNAR